MARASAAVPIESFTTFGALLKYVRVRARLSQTELGIAVGYSPAQISRLEHSQRLPELTTLVALFVPALDLVDEPETVARLLELAAAARGEPRSGRKSSASATPSWAQTGPPAAAGARGSSAGDDERNTLPVAATPLLGRDQDVAAVRELLARPAVRLVTLLGPPGVGKTRLSVEVARALTPTFGDGVRFVPLAALRDPALVVPTIARGIGMAESSEPERVEHLKRALHHRHLLLVLDNFEHILPASTILSELLAAAPALKLLVTSRAALHVSTEHAYPVPPLPLPELAPPPPQLAQNPAVALFTARAQAADPAFALTSANAPPVAAICVQLDGLPLAIELAAARTRLLAPQALLTHLQQTGMRRLGVLTGGARDLPRRHQTLVAAITWSYDLLPPAEQRLFRTLAVFAGGWTIEAAAAVCEGPEAGEPGGASGLPSLQIVDGLQSLLDHSLVQQAGQPGAETRFMLLETIRQYALEQLEACGEEAEARARHAAYFRALVVARERQPQGKHRPTWFDQLEREHDNIRAALAWLIDADPAAAQQLAGDLTGFWHKRGYLREGQAWLARALARSEAPTASRAHALVHAGLIAQAQGDTPAALGLLEAGLALSRELGDVRGAAGALRSLGWTTFIAEDVERSAALFEEALCLGRQVGDRAMIAGLLYSAAHARIMNGDVAFFPRAHRYLDESQQLYSELDDPNGMGAVRGAQGALALMQGDYPRARDLFNAELAMQQEIGNTTAIPICWYMVAEAERLQGDLTAARQHVREAYRRSCQLGLPSGTTVTLRIWGQIEQQRGELARARHLFRRSLGLAMAVQDTKTLVICLFGLGAVALALGDAGQAARLFAAGEQRRAALPPFLFPADRESFAQWIAAVRSTVGETAFAAAWAAQRAMPAEALTAALADGTLPAPGASTRGTGQPKGASGSPPGDRGAPPSALTPRERAVAVRIAQGASNRAIGTALGISERTVERHVAKIFAKLGVSSRARIAAWAVEGGLTREAW